MTDKSYKWYDDGLVLRRFFLALEEAGVLEELDEIVAFFTKPWKYNEYHDLWAENGAPEKEGEDGWDDFIEGLSGEDDDEPEEEEDE